MHKHFLNVELLCISRSFFGRAIEKIMNTFFHEHCFEYVNIFFIRELSKITNCFFVHKHIMIYRTFFTKSKNNLKYQIILNKKKAEKHIVNTRKEKGHPSRS